MGFSEVVSVPAIALGGTDKKTGKPNPKQVEGYYLRTREVPDNKKKSGVSYIHEFETSRGVTPVWGKTDMDRKMRNVIPGTMVRVTFTGQTRPTPNGDMIIYKVEQDKSNVIEVNEPVTEETAAEEPEDYSSEAEEQELDSEEQPADEVPPTRPTAGKRPTATAPSAERQAKVAALLAGKRVS